MTLDDARMRHFLTLSAEEQAAAVRRLIARGFGDHSIASATHLSVEQVRLIRRATAGSETPTGHHAGHAVAAPFAFQGD